MNLERPLWSFRGTKRYVSIEPQFERDRPWLLPLLDAFAGRDVGVMRDETAAALLRPAVSK